MADPFLELENLDRHQDAGHVNELKDNGPHDFLTRISHEVFKYDMLDRRLKRHHITGIAFSGAVGIGLFQTSGGVIALGGPGGALIAFIFAGLLVISVMRTLAEMVSIIPVKGAIVAYPGNFVDEALGFTVGITYWLANCMSMVTLTIAAAMFTQYWGSRFNLTAATFVLLIIMAMLNACGVRLYGNLEWIFKWLKIILIVIACTAMIAIRIGAGPGPLPKRNYEISPGYNSTGFFEGSDQVQIQGTGGRIAAVWTCLILAMFQFMGGEIVLVTAAEAEDPKRDLPKAARYMYILPITFYLIGIFLVGLCINYRDPRLPHPHVPFMSDPRLNGIFTVERSPFGIVIINAGIRFLPDFMNAGFLFSATTAANSALYASSRTIFLMASNVEEKSRFVWIKNSIGHTNNGHTPLAAIFVSFVPGLLAFLAVGVGKPTFQEPIAVLGRLYTGPMICIYASFCIAFLRMQKGMKLFPNTIDRSKAAYMSKYYRAHWQPMWAILGLVMCILIAVTMGWAAIFDLCTSNGTVSRHDSIVDVATAYIGPILFLTIYFGYKILYQTGIRPLSSFERLWDPEDIPKGPSRPHRRLKGGRWARLLDILSWIK